MSSSGNDRNSRFVARSHALSENRTETQIWITIQINLAFMRSQRRSEKRKSVLESRQKTVWLLLPSEIVLRRRKIYPDVPFFCLCSWWAAEHKKSVNEVMQKATKQEKWVMKGDFFSVAHREILLRLQIDLPRSLTSKNQWRGENERRLLKRNECEV